MDKMHNKKQDFGYCDDESYVSTRVDCSTQLFNQTFI